MLIIEKPSNERDINDAELRGIIRRKIALAEQATGEGKLETAARSYKEAAEASFELGDFEGAMKLLDRHEDACKQRVAMGSRIAVYIGDLQKKVDHAINLAKYGQARDLLKQMLAIAEQGRDVPAIKAIKQQLATLHSRMVR